MRSQFLLRNTQYPCILINDECTRAGRSLIECKHYLHGVSAPCAKVAVILRADRRRV